MKSEKEAVGWREWLDLPDLGGCAIKAKLDTGARTSALHTSFIEKYEDDGIAMVRFGIRPYRKNEEYELECRAPIVDERVVVNSGGAKENRIVIETLVQLGDNCWPVEITLTSRDQMKFRMLLGRTALAGKYVVDPSLSYIFGRRKIKRGVVK